MKLLSNSAIYLSGSIVSRLLSLLSLPFLTQVLTPAEYGVIAMLTMVGIFACSIFSMGLGTSIGEVYFREQDNQRRRAVIATGFLIILLSHALFVALALPLGGQIGEFFLHSDKYAYVTVMMLTGQLAQNVVFPLQLKMQFEERARIAALAMIFSSSVSVGLALLFVVVEQRGLSGYAEATVVGAVIQALTYLGLARVDFSNVRLSLIKELIRKGWPMILSFLFLFVMQYGVRLPIEWFGGLEVLGLYQIGASLAAPMGMITSAFVNAWTPYALGFASKPNEASHSLAAATRLYVILVGVMVLIIFMISPWAAQLLVADEYYESYYVIGLGALWYYYSSIFSLLLPPVYFAGEVSRTVVRTQAVTVVFFVGIGIPLIQFSPLVGAAVSIALAGLILVCVQLFWNKVLMSSRYVQIKYDSSMYFSMVLIGLGGVAILSLDFFIGRGTSVAAGALMVALLLRIGWVAANADQKFRLIQFKIFGEK